MSAEAVEKRWTSLRDMFSRECRRQKQLQRSGSGYEAVKEWDLYKNMQFLSPHIAHRRTKTSLIPINQDFSSENNTTIGEFLSCADDISRSSSPVLMEHDYIANIEPAKGNEVIVTNVRCGLMNRPSSAISSCSDSSIQPFLTPSTSSSHSTFSDSPVVFKLNEKIIPDLNCYAKRRKGINEKIEEDIQKNYIININCIKSIENVMFYKQTNSADGYMSAIAEGLQHVPSKMKTQCLIEILQIIQKYEDWQQ